MGVIKASRYHGVGAVRGVLSEGCFFCRGPHSCNEVTLPSSHTGLTTPSRIFLPRGAKGRPAAQPGRATAAPAKNNKALELEMCREFTLPQKNVRNLYCLDRDLLGIAR